MITNDTVPELDEEEDENLKISFQDIPDTKGCLLVVLTGYIDTFNSNYFQNQVRQLIEKGFVRLIFNCQDLTYISSSGIGVFTVFLKAVKSRGGDLVLLQIQPKVYEVLQLIGFSQFFNIHDKLDEAILSFRNYEPEAIVEVFPKVFPCPICSKELRAVKPGCFRCPECKAILSMDNSGVVSIG
jgi:anti-anti-sigma factor